MKIHKWKDVRAAKFSPEKLREIDQAVQKEILKINLRALREILGVTQQELSKKVKMTQADISKLERRPDFLLSTLRRYVESLGGELELRANFGDKSVRLHAPVGEPK